MGAADITVITVNGTDYWANQVYFHLEGLQCYGDAQCEMQKKELRSFNTIPDEFLSYEECERENLDERDCGFSGLVSRYPQHIYTGNSVEELRQKVREQSTTPWNVADLIGTAALSLLVLAFILLRSRQSAPSALLPISVGASILGGMRFFG